LWITYKAKGRLRFGKWMDLILEFIICCSGTRAQRTCSFICDWTANGASITWPTVQPAATGHTTITLTAGREYGNGWPAVSGIQMWQLSFSESLKSVWKTHACIQNNLYLTLNLWCFFCLPLLETICLIKIVLADYCCDYSNVK